MLAQEVLAQGHVYYLSDSAWEIIYPLLDISGIAIQLFAILKKKLSFLFIGMAFILFGAIMESDITLLVGDLLLTGAVFYCLKKNNPHNGG